MPENTAVPICYPSPGSKMKNQCQVIAANGAQTINL